MNERQPRLLLYMTNIIAKFYFYIYFSIIKATYHVITDRQILKNPGLQKKCNELALKFDCKHVFMIISFVIRKKFHGIREYILMNSHH